VKERCASHPCDEDSRDGIDWRAGEAHAGIGHLLQQRLQLELGGETARDFLEGFGFEPAAFLVAGLRVREPGIRRSEPGILRDGTLEEQYYTIYRDLRSWTTALTLRIRDNRSGPTDISVALTASLKAFPRFGLGRDRARPEQLLGY